MTLRQYIIIMLSATLLCWAIWCSIIFYYNPQTAGFLGFVFFYASLFLSILGTYSIVGFLFRAKMIKNEEIVFRYIKRICRQGIFFGLYICLILILAQFHFLTWWNFIILTIFYIFLESMIFTNRKYQNRNYVK